VRKLRTDGRPIRIEYRLEALQEALAGIPGLIAAYLFGSYGTPRQTPLSDVDLALVFRLGEEPDVDAEMTARAAVLDALQEEDVTIVFLNKAGSPFQYEVLSTGRRLFCSDATALADFIERVLKVHGEYVIDYEPFLEEYGRALRERYGIPDHPA
jgi:predicted nucleotidyltransferase